jgi:hypothetical protein
MVPALDVHKLALLNCKMSDFIYDPRPLDPPDYFDKVMSNTATWIVQRTKVRYSPEEKIFKKNVSQEHGEGSMKDVLQVIAQIHGGDSPDECEIFIDATQIVSRSEARQPVYFEVNFSDTHDVHWVLKEKTSAVDEDTDPDELFALAEYMINEGREFSIEFGTIDPTPQYLYDNSGGEAPVTMQEIHSNAFNQKQELRK